jgi:hypothetical protein
VTVYATASELEARLSPAYTAPTLEDANIVLQKASEVIDEATLGRAQSAYDDDVDGDYGWRVVLSNAVCDQVEFWLEVGEEHDVASLRGSLVAGRVQIHPVAGKVGDRAKRTLMMGGLLYRGVPSR